MQCSMTIGWINFYFKNRLFWLYLGQYLDFGKLKKMNSDLYNFGHFLFNKFQCMMTSREDDLYVSKYVRAEVPK